MPRKKKSSETKANEYFDKIRTSKKAREHEETKWKKWIDYYETRYYDLTDFEIDGLQSDLIAINLLKANIQTMQAAVYFRNPKVYARPKREEFRKKAPLCESVINYWIDELDFKKQMRKCTLDWFVVGHSWDKIGYYANVSESERGQDASGAETETDINIRNGQPFVRRVSPFRMLADTGCTDYEHARWVAEEILMPYEEARRKYPELKDIGLSDLAVPESISSSGAYDQDRWGVAERKEGFVKLYQVWYKEYNKDTDDYDIRVMMLAEGWDEPLSDDKDQLGLEGFPYEYLPWDECIDKFYPQAMAEVIEDLLLEYNKLRSMELNHLKRFARKYEARRDAFDDAGKTALRSGEDGYVFEVDTLDVPNIRAIEDAPLDAQHSTNIRLIESEVRQLIGLDEFIKGSGSPSMTATQTAEISRGTSLRVQWRKDMLEDFLIKTVRKLWMVLQQYHDTEDMLPIVGPDGLTEYQKYSREEIQGEYKLEIGVNSTSPPDRQQDIKNAIDRYNLLRNDPKVDARTLIVDILTADGMENIEKYVKRPESLEQELIQKENQALQKGTPTMAHPGDDHQMHLKAQEPLAKKLATQIQQLQSQFEGMAREAQGGTNPNAQAQAQQMQQQLQQIQKLAQVWQAHVQQHHAYIETDMGAGEVKPRGPVDPNIMNRRTTRQADLIAEFQGG